MKKILFVFHLLYYALVIIVYVAFFCMASLMLNLFGKADNLGAVIMVTHAVLFLMTPVLIAVLMRFSMLRWYVDPIAAAETPLFLYVSMIIKQAKYSGSFETAFHLVNLDLKDDGGIGWMFLFGLFVFSLLMSFSFARKKGESISYRLISKISGRRGA